MLVFLGDEDVRGAVEPASLVEHLRIRLGEEANGLAFTAPRSNVTCGRSFARVGAAILSGDEGVIGFKAFHAGREGGVRYLIALASLASGELLALIDADFLTAARTGAVTALATDLIAADYVEKIGVIGSGVEAFANLEAICSVRAPSTVAVYSPRPDHRSAFADRVHARLGISAIALSSPAEAVAGAAITLVATNTRRAPDPIAFRAEWLEPGMHVNSIGSTTRSLRELEEGVFGAVDVVVADSRQAIEHESGDVVAAVEAGFDITTVRELGAIIAAREAVRVSSSQITLFKSVGTAIQDLATAEWVHRTCRASGRGVEVPITLAEKTMEL